MNTANHIKCSKTYTIILLVAVSFSSVAIKAEKIPVEKIDTVALTEIGFRASSDQSKLKVFPVLFR